MQRVSLAGGWHDATGNSKGAGSQGYDASTDCQVNWCNAVIDMAHCRGDNDRPEVLGDGFIEATTWGEGMSGDHNMYQKPRSYLDDFECPRCGHCCKTDLARVGEVGVWGEWVGLTDDEVFELADTNLYEGGKNYGVLAFAKAIEQALKEKNA